MLDEVGAIIYPREVSNDTFTTVLYQHLHIVMHHNELTVTINVQFKSNSRRFSTAKIRDRLIRHLPFTSTMARDNDFMEVDSDSDISILDGGHNAPSKGKGKAKATDKHRADKGKGKPKDVVWVPQSSQCTDSDAN